MTTRDLEKVAGFYIFDSSDVEYMKQLTSSGVDPQSLANIAAEALEELGKPLADEVAQQLRNGEANKYIAARLGYA